MIYLLIIIILLFLCYLYDYRGNEKGRLLSYILVMIYLICLAGFRYRMGTDALKYEYHYSQEHTITELTMGDFRNTRFAPLYIILSSICRTVTPEFMFVQFLIAIIVNMTVFKFVWDHTRHIFFAILLYLFFLYIMLNMEVYREAMAACVFLWSWQYFRDGKWVKYYILATVAFFFHVSAIVLFILPICCCPGIKSLFTLGKQTYIIAPLLLVASFGINYVLFDFIQMIALTDTMAERAETYSKHALGGNLLNMAGALTQIIKYVAYPMVALYFVKKNSNSSRSFQNGEGQKMEIVSMVAIYSALLSVGIAIFHRYHHYFYIFPIVIMSEWVFSWMKVRSKKISLNFIYWIFIFLPLIGLQLYSVYFTHYNKSGTIKVYMMYYPYSNQFDKEIDPDRAKAIRYSRRY